MLIPIGSPSGSARGDLNKANSIFAQAASHQALATEIIGRLFTMPYIAIVACVSLLKSSTPGALFCIRQANS